MQGIKPFIPTDKKAKYIQSLLACGFDTIDFGSFVSPKAIPQMQDTAEVLSRLDLSGTRSKLLAIVANLRGAKDACQHKEIDYLGYPFSISENFQMRNTHKTIAESLEVLKDILEVAQKHDKQVVAYLSMGFGNPYGDPWNADIVGHWTDKLVEMGIRTISLSDTIGSSKPDDISYIFSSLMPQYPKIEFGAHLHTTPGSWQEKVEAAWSSGCRRFDGALKGYGGCPMAKDELTGNMPTENLLSFFEQKGIKTTDDESLSQSISMAGEVF